MDPAFVDNSIWHDLSTMLRLLWVYIVIIIGAAFTFLAAHAIIPSLAGSGLLPPRIARLRPLLYIGSLGVFLLAMGIAILILLQADVTQRVLTKWWI